jgi:hypothetical protein
MSIQGKNSLSYKKKNVQESNTPYTGFKNITFAHEFAAAGESFIPFSSLVTPARWTESGLTNPDPSSLLNAQLQAFRPNVTVTSSAKGLIQKEEYIVYSNRIEFKDFVSEVNEVFEVEVSDIMISGNLIVDMQTIRVEGDLADTETDFNMGYEFDVLNEEIIVFRDGLQMFRSDNNESSGTTGNYYYLDTGSGKASVIRFFEASVGSESILVASTGGRVDNPNVSTFQEIEKLQGQIDAMVPTVASLAGVPETDFQSSPNRVDLKIFGDLLVQLKEEVNAINNKEVTITTTESFTSTVQIVGGSVTAFNTFNNTLSVLASTPILSSGDIEVTVLEDCLITVHGGARATNNLATVDFRVNGVRRGLNSFVTSTNQSAVGGGSFVEELSVGDVITIGLGNQDNTTENTFALSAVRTVKTKVIDL